MQKLFLGALFYIASFGANAGPSPDAFSAFTVTLAQKSVVDDPSAPYGFDISFVVSGSGGLKLESANLQIDNSPQGCINDDGGVGNGNLAGTSGQYESTDFGSGGLNAGTYAITLSIYGDDNCLGTEGEASGAITIESRVSNVAPVAVDDSVSSGVIEDTAYSSATSLIQNDTDADGDNLTATAGTFSTGQSGSIVIQSDGSYAYTPAGNFNGTDTASYTVSDSALTDTGTLTITVAAVNDVPVAVDDSVSSGVTEGVAFNSVTSLIANDSDAETK